MRRAPVLALAGTTIGVLAVGQALPAQGAHVRPRKATWYEGKTREGLPLRFRTSRRADRVGDLRVRATLRCRDGSAAGRYDGGILRALRLRGSTFRLTRGHTRVEGRFRRRTLAEGRVRLVLRRGDGVLCDSGWIAWQARATRR